MPGRRPELAGLDFIDFPVGHGNRAVVDVTWPLALVVAADPTLGAAARALIELVGRHVPGGRDPGRSTG